MNPNPLLPEVWMFGIFLQPNQPHPNFGQSGYLYDAESLEGVADCEEGSPFQIA